MSKPRTQAGYIYERNGAWHVRFYVHEDGKSKQRSRFLCLKNDEYPSKDAYTVQHLAAKFMATINEANGINDTQPTHRCPICQHRCPRTLKGRFAPKELQQNV